MSRFLGAALFTIAVVVSACAVEQVSATSITSANQPRPDSTGVSSRTIDNAGYHDNAGHTTDEVVRSQLSGMRVTELGSERITGTPGSGLPVPIEPRIEQRPTRESGGAPPPTSPAGGPATTTAVIDEAVARVARARCDRETACNRVGPGRRIATQDSCVVQDRVRARQELGAYSCDRGIDMIAFGTCLNKLRLLPCETAATELDGTLECSQAALCP